jgi:acyl carrier protein
LHEAALRDHLSRDLPDYMMPGFFMQLDELPLTTNGKIDRKTLPDPVIKAGDEHIAPRNDTEKKLAKAWAEVLNIDEEVIGIDSDFFLLGGHSLTATVLTAKIHKVFNIKIPLTEVFKTSTIRGLSKNLIGAEEEQYLSIEPVPCKEFYALSSEQNGLYILQQMDLQSTASNIFEFYLLNKKYEKDKLANIFSKLIQRHDSLRTSFQIKEGRPIQKIYETVDFEIEYDDHSSWAVEDMVSHFVRPFDLSQAPLLRVKMTGINENRYILMVDMHHIISDGVSHDILLQEFISLDAGDELLPLRLQYKDYSEWQNNHTQNQAIKKQEEYWLKVFADRIPRLSIPMDFTAPVTRNYAGSSLSFLIGKEETNVLRKMALEENVSLFIVLLAIYNIFLFKISGQEDIVVGTAVSGRNHADLEKVIGVFINILPLRNFPQKEISFKTFLRDVGKKAFDAFENQNYQFNDFVEKVTQTRNQDLFTVGFTQQNIKKPLAKIPSQGNRESLLENKIKYSKLLMNLEAYETEEQVLFIFIYQTQLFKAETIKKYAAYFQAVLTDVTKHPRKRIKEIEIISKDEKNRIQSEIQETQQDFQVDFNI